MKLGKKKWNGKFLRVADFFVLAQMNLARPANTKFHYFLSHLLAVSLFLSCFQIRRKATIVLPGTTDIRTSSHASTCRTGTRAEKMTFHSQK